MQKKYDKCDMYTTDYITNDIEVIYKSVGNRWNLITSSEWKNSQNATVGGVGFLMNQQAYKIINNIESINKRMMIATFNGNPEASIISCYSPKYFR